MQPLAFFINVLAATAFFDHLHFCSPLDVTAVAILNVVFYRIYAVHFGSNHQFIQTQTVQVKCLVHYIKIFNVA